MLINKEEIKTFIENNYSPGTVETANQKLQLTSSSVLHLLFDIFPEGCIDDYDVYEILTSLNYKPQKKSANEFVWCFIEKSETKV